MTNASLTPRQRDVAALVARGATNKDIAAELGLTPGTVKFYLHQMYARLGICGPGDFRVRLVLWSQSQVYEQMTTRKLIASVVETFEALRAPAHADEEVALEISDLRRAKFARISDAHPRGRAHRCRYPHRRRNNPPDDYPLADDSIAEAIARFEMRLARLAAMVSEIEKQSTKL